MGSGVSLLDWPPVSSQSISSFATLLWMLILISALIELLVQCQNPFASFCTSNQIVSDNHCLVAALCNHITVLQLTVAEQSMTAELCWFSFSIFSLHSFCGFLLTLLLGAAAFDYGLHLRLTVNGSCSSIRTHGVNDWSAMKPRTHQAGFKELTQTEAGH